MKVLSNNIAFGNKTITTQSKNLVYTKEFNNNGNLISYTEKDILNDRFILSEKYDETGKIITRQHFEYLPDKTIETVSGIQNYKRIITKEIKDSLIHITEEYLSSSEPSRNYLYKIIKNLEGKIISWTSNGKKII